MTALDNLGCSGFANLSPTVTLQPLVNAVAYQVKSVLATVSTVSPGRQNPAMSSILHAVKQGASCLQQSRGHLDCSEAGLHIHKQPHYREPSVSGCAEDGGALCSRPPAPARPSSALQDEELHASGFTNKVLEMAKQRPNYDAYTGMTIVLECCSEHIAGLYTTLWPMR